jgi:polynucleotide 5'-hydroxyl-kinase GRC3/NOL9
VIAAGGMRRVLVIGPPDAGKSSFCRALVGAVAQHRATALLDGDVGQKTIGPPACLTLGRAVGGSLALCALAFVGTTDPVRGWKRVIDGLRGLAAQAEADAVIVNTGGLLSGPGLRLKQAKIETLAPDLVIAIGDHPVLGALGEAYPTRPCLRLAPSPQARRKSGAERQRARREAFQRYFAKARTWTAPISVLTPGSSTDSTRPLPSGLLVGIRDQTGRDAGLGILLDDDPASGTLALLTPVPEQEAGSVCPGELILNSDFGEKRIEPELKPSAEGRCA